MEIMPMQRGGRLNSHIFAVNRNILNIRYISWGACHIIYTKPSLEHSTHYSPIATFRPHDAYSSVAINIRA